MPIGVYSRDHLPPETFRRPVAPVAERFAKRFLPEPNSGCWLWEGTVTLSGYGVMTVDGKRKYATHISKELSGDPRPSTDHIACHKCDVPSCVNPEHIFWGTNQDNVNDMNAKGRHWASKRTSCKHGHPWTVENTKFDRHGGKYCNHCNRIRSAKRRAVRAARLA